MPVLYKYVGPGGSADNPAQLPPQFLNMSLLASDPRSFNDPFEVRPYFDQECHDHFARTHESMYERALGLKHSLIAGRSMVGIPTENAVGFGEHLNKQFRDQLGKQFRILCLSRTRASVLMWGHYTHSYRGFAIGIDTDHVDFPKGLKLDGFDVQYSPDRSRTKLPLAFYQSPSVESYDLRGNIANLPDEPVISNGGLVIPFKEYRRQVEEAMLTALTSKAQDWKYEQEVRFIYDLPQHKRQLAANGGRHFARIPTAALKEIIVGFNATFAQVQELVALYRSGKIGNPQLFYTTCHPNLYEVQAHQATDNYLLDYFRIVLPDQ